MAVELEYDYDTAIAAMDKFCQEDFNSLKEWTKKLDKSKYVPKDLTDKQLLLFYNACYGDIERSKTCIERYYNLRKNTPEIFDNRCLSSDELQPSVEALEFSVLPEKSHDGYDLIYHRLHYTEPSKYHFEPGCKLLFMTVDACLHKRGPQPGYIFLFDMQGVKLGHLTRVSLSFQKDRQRSLRKFFQYVQEAMPVRMRAIHVFNTEPILDKLLLLIRPFMDKKFFDMIKFHHKNEDLENFYQTVIPRSALPPLHGGTLPDTQTLHKKCMQTLKALEPYFKAEEEQRINALPDKKRDKALERSFKHLDID
ncbi:Retinaldehyde-binding protein 1 protein 2 [Danaus plexippus plexippus]|uniref:Retinaldehyde-binding protein 1 protein 2 n=1 Tax=Danaus plexippus plexippus TaxID=278856 RepID=A0A212FMV7_DANPL|nr:alpha-tocopherol transfer protein-like isoform X1 [Danaus plexippus plexippus]OWR55075.1 Retinaldehyde-binding protein 1 protein 2 [Danaus plexippus plexippus]